MGNRVSIQFANENETSVVLFSHWGGMEFVDEAKQYVKDLKKEIESLRKEISSGPLTRLEPNTVMVDFIREFSKDMHRVESDFYLGKDEDDGDNSDNGHIIIHLENKKMPGLIN